MIVSNDDLVFEKLDSLIFLLMRIQSDIGGDEFVVILKGCDYEKREELEGSFRKTIDENQRNGLVVVSSGMAVYQPEKEDTYNDVFKRADQLMYERKQALKTAAKQQA